MIKEISSINFDVQSVAKDISRKVEDYVKSGKLNFIKSSFIGYPTFETDTVRFECDYFKGTVKSINCIFYHLTAAQYLQYKNYFDINGTYDKDNKQVNADIICMEDDNGKMCYTLPNFEQTLVHEFEHGFQYQFGHLKNGKFYNKSIAAYNNPKIDETIRQVCYGMYYFASSEIDAKANELYNELVNDNVQTKEEGLETLTYLEFLTAVQTVKTNLQTVENNPELKSAIEKLLNTRFQTIKKIILNNIGVCRRKYGKVISYYLFEKENNQRLLNETTDCIKFFAWQNENRKRLFESF